MRRQLIVLAYLVIGLVVASQHSYLSNLTAIKSALSAVLAVILWPLLLLGVNLTIH